MSVTTSRLRTFVHLLFLSLAPLGCISQRDCPLVCPEDQRCFAFAGSASCQCKAGFRPVGEGCEAITCAEANGECSNNARCIDEQPVRHCECLPGFEGDGFDCRDVDECLEEKGGCAAVAACINTPGGHSCDCGEFYSGDGRSCSPASECLEDNGGCPAGAQCSGSGTTLSCACGPGYSGDGNTCEDVDECAVDNGGCGSDSTCTNTSGSNSCACMAGKYGDGRTCRTAIAQVSAGNGHTCAIKADGSLWCWGSYTLEEFGGFIHSEQPRKVASEGGEAWRGVAAANDFTVAIRADGTLWGWGSATPVQSWKPEQIGSAGDWVKVVAGRDHACAIKEDDSLWCWGSNGQRQLGNAGRPVTLELPNAVAGEGRWESIDAGYNHTCGIQEDGSLWCWGTYHSGRSLGTSKTGPIQLGAGERWISVAAQYDRTCAVHEDHSLWCWGRDLDSESLWLDEAGRIAVPAGETVEVVGGGLDKLCVLTRPGDLLCWSPSSEGGAFVRMDAGNDRPWSSVSAGTTHACAIQDDGSLWCFGWNSSGKLGWPTWTVRPRSWLDLPGAPGIGGDTWQSVSAATMHACGIRDARRLWCWGMNSYGGLGSGSLDDAGFEAISPTTRWAQVSAGKEQTCGVREDQSLWCWGVRVTSGGRSLEPPHEVAPGTSWRWVSTSGGNLYPAMLGSQEVSGLACGVRTDGSLWCWSRGAGVTEAEVDVPLPLTRMGNENDWVSVSVARIPCARKRSGLVFCAIGPDDGATKPVEWRELLGSERTSRVIQQEGELLALTPHGRLWRYQGINLYPVEVVSDLRWVDLALSAGEHGMLGVDPEGRLWQFDSFWQYEEQRPLTRVGEHSDWVSVSGTTSHGCGLRRGGSLWCWGYLKEDFGQVSFGAGD